MATKETVKSIEPNIADLANGWLKAYKLDYKLEQESLNTEIDAALNDYFSKNGGVDGNRPDCKLLLQDKALSFYPVLIEYKGYKDKLVKLDSVTLSPDMVNDSVARISDACSGSVTPESPLETSCCGSLSVLFTSCSSP